MARLGVKVARCATVVALATFGLALPSSASASARLVAHAGTASRTTYHFTMAATGVGSHSSDTYTGHGTFQVGSGTTGTYVIGPHGSMSAVMHGPRGAHTVLMTLTRAFSADGLRLSSGVKAVFLRASFRVTRSSLRCAPVRMKVLFYLTFRETAPGSGIFIGQLCARRTFDFHTKASLSHS
jgi:hypothetical protein